MAEYFLQKESFENKYKTKRKFKTTNHIYRYNHLKNSYLLHYKPHHKKRAYVKSLVKYITDHKTLFDMTNADIKTSRFFRKRDLHGRQKKTKNKNAINSNHIILENN